MRALLLAAACAGAGGIARAQVAEYELGPDGTWRERTALAVEGSADQQVIARAREALAAGQPSPARASLRAWLEENERSRKPEVPEALLLRGDAIAAMGDEDDALYDYEKIIKRFPQSEFYVTALEREFEIARRYVQGRRKKFLGMRIQDAGDLGIEMLIRVQERLPGSVLAEKSAIEMADYYFRRREMDLAAESYDLYLINFPNGPNRRKAMERRVYASIGRFRGPEHDSAGLLDAREQVRTFAMQYPEAAAQQGLDASLVARIDESLGLQRLDTAKWYLRTGDETSARITLERLVSKHPLSAAARTARQMQKERGWASPEPGSDGESGRGPEAFGPDAPEAPGATDAPAPTGPRP